MRIAIAGLAHEALTFFPESTRMTDFDLWEGDEILDYPGIPGLAEELDIELVPVLIAQTRSPGGCVEQATFQALRDRIVDGIVRAGDVDGICLVLHGALLVDDVSSGETDLVRALRRQLFCGAPGGGKMLAVLGDHRYAAARMGRVGPPESNQHL